MSKNINSNDGGGDSASGSGRSGGGTSKKEFRVIEILGMTHRDGVKYFMLSLENSCPKYIKASLANELFPNKVIDFYLKNYRFVKPIENELTSDDD